MTAIDDFITDLQGGKYSDADQNLIAKISTAVAALQQIQGGLIPGVPAAANTIFAGPGSGVPTLPSFRALVSADIPSLAALYLALTGGTMTGTFTAVDGSTWAAAGIAMALGKTITPASVAGIAGTTTNDNAAAGSIGEFIETVVTAAAPVALVTGVQKDMGSVALTAGDWDISASLGTVPAGTTTTSAIVGGLSLVANTLPAAEFLQTNGTPSVAGNNAAVALPRRRFSLPAPATIHAVTVVNFAVSTLSIAGFINARRVR